MDTSLIMKSIFIFSILYLVAVAKAENEFLSKVNSECRREIFNKYIEKDLTYENVESIIEGLKSPFEDEGVCMLACVLRKSANAKGKTLYKGLLHIIDKAYMRGFESTEFSRQDVESKINNCFVLEQNECGFFKCVELRRSPFVEIFGYDTVMHMMYDLFE